MEVRVCANMDDRDGLPTTASVDVPSVAGDDGVDGATVEVKVRFHTIMLWVAVWWGVFIWGMWLLVRWLA